MSIEYMFREKEEEWLLICLRLFHFSTLFVYHTHLLYDLFMQIFALKIFTSGMNIEPFFQDSINLLE